MDMLFEWIQGQLSPAARIWTALAPALVLLAYVMLSLLCYVAVYSRRGAYADGEIEHRGSSIFLSSFLRRYFAWAMQPFFRLLLATGIPATAVTTLSLLLALGSGLAVSAGRFALGGWLYIFAGILDYFDGRLARTRGTSSNWGAALDSILDRYSDAAILMGLAWFYRDHWALLPALLALVGSLLVPYIRAKGESLGVAVKVGVMQRAERIAYLGALVALSPVLEAARAPTMEPVHGLAVGGLVLLAASTQLTAIQRVVFVLRALRPPRAITRMVPPRQLLRLNSAAALATLMDGFIVLMLVERMSMSPVLATAIGLVMGAAIHYSLLRRWIFRGTSQGPNGPRFLFVSITSMLLNAGGVAVFLILPEMPYIIAWPIVRMGVYLAWNLPLRTAYLYASQDTSDVMNNRRCR